MQVHDASKMIIGNFYSKYTPNILRFYFALWLHIALYKFSDSDLDVVHFDFCNRNTWTTPTVLTGFRSKTSEISELDEH